MKKINKLQISHTSGYFDFLKSKTPTLEKDKVEEFQKFKEHIFTLYRKLNNAYKIYFQGAVLKSKAPRKEGEPAPPSMKIDFQGKWGFQLGDDKTSLGQAIHSLYAFLSKIENTKYTTTEGKGPKTPEPKQEQLPGIQESEQEVKTPEPGAEEEKKTPSKNPSHTPE